MELFLASRLLFDSSDSFQRRVAVELKSYPGDLFLDRILAPELEDRDQLSP